MVSEDQIIASVIVSNQRNTFMTALKQHIELKRFSPFFFETRLVHVNVQFYSQLAF